MSPKSILLGTLNLVRGQSTWLSAFGGGVPRWQWASTWAASAHKPPTRTTSSQMLPIPAHSLQRNRAVRFTTLLWVLAKLGLFLSFSVWSGEMLAEQKVKMLTAQSPTQWSFKQQQKMQDGSSRRHVDDLVSA
ncbi:hypothetical protein BJ138DRAFT_1104277 [Hygrophoropsis aurantiaca]|uniref:Uncharacterized protein n=1 Tax=Hygrophoropsis aurantiaca TaxID=72124 RepID=A0ACB8A2W9_9AGAM|nr:hypothetical protein BJ138DRAFT_1104277 [Hygrophoropsis aurantiaca]